MSAQPKPLGDYEPTLNSVVAEAGGPRVLMALGGEEEAFRALWAAQDRLIEKHGAQEVVRLKHDVMMGYCCGLFC